MLVYYTNYHTTNSTTTIYIYTNHTTTTTTAGRLPLHWAIERLLPLPTLMCIHQAYAVQGAHVSDNRGNNSTATHCLYYTLYSIYLLYCNLYTVFMLYAVYTLLY